MMRWRQRVSLWLACGTLAFGVSVSPAEEPAPTVEAIRAAVAKSLPLLTQGAIDSMAKRKNCFTCHNQGLPIMALTTAQQRGFEIDEETLSAALKFTADFLAKNRDNYRDGKGQAGRTFMAGYAIWALQHGQWPADDTTAAVTEYFLKYQSDRDHWDSHSNRPPSEASHFTPNFLGLLTLQSYGVDEQRERIAARREQVLQWLLQAKPVDHEDRVFRFRALSLAGAKEAALAAAANEILETQQLDGGWKQTDELGSDPYATGTALVALQRTGRLPVTDERYRKGLIFLLNSQLEDGSWHVVTRSKPFQTYYESGYPHEKDQFISITAGGWATIALTLALPEPGPSAR